MSGHTVLQLPVPALESWVVARHRHYDPAFVSADPAFGHAHITALGPFDPAPSSARLEAVGAIAATTAPITVVLAELDQFPNGVIHLRPEPGDELRRLTARLVEAYPEHPPYAGDFGPVVVPHLTLDAAGESVSIASTRALLGGVVPVSCTLAMLQLAWWESGACRVLREWALGQTWPPG